MRTLQQAHRFEGKIGFNISGTADIPVQVEASGGWEALGPRCSQVR
jgi:NCAIR mutase (PurE)-related protein